MAAGLLLAACGGSPSEPWSRSESQPGGPVAPDPATSEASGLVLSEVGFSPVSGESAFVEIANAGPEPAELAGLLLLADDRPIGVDPVEPALGPGERLLVVLDGPADPEPLVVHAVADLGSTGGSVQLIGSDQRLLDAAAWGPGHPGAVSMAVGDFAPASIEPGTTIGRVPGADRPLTPTDWVAYPPDAASPGTANPVPTVPVLLPLHGTLVDDSDAELAWYPVRGATSYRVEVSTDPSFDELVVDESVVGTALDVADLAPGDYVWRVGAVAPDGSASVPSESSGFSRVAGSSAETPGRARAADVDKRLPVPFLPQHKDTTMLLLEEPHEVAPMAWDAPHNPPRREDPADQQNCFLAVIAMLNHFYGGDLSQDRIGYQLFKDRQPGPEEDLNYGYGLVSGGTASPGSGREDDVLEAFTFALGATPTVIPSIGTFDAMWAAITSAIDAGRPLAAAGPRHGYVITGYAVRNGHRIMIYNDPARGRREADIDTPGGNAAQLTLWLMPDGVDARAQETTVTKDSDGDGVVDFDETERFHTDRSKADSDGDRVPDKADIVAGVFDEAYGYALKGGSRGRDFDGDGLPTELDPDSDHGACLDGDEDMNGDGHQSDEESWNFDAQDDRCGDLSGTITWTLHDTYDVQGGQSTSDDVVTLNVRFDEQDGEWVDAGSSYTWTGSSRLDINPGDDPEAGYCNEHHKTTTTTGGQPFADALVSSIYIDVLRDTDEVYVTSWVAGELRVHVEDGTLTSNGGPDQFCVLVPSDSTQGGGSSEDSQAEWGQVPRCHNAEESVQGTIADDGQTVSFSCDSSETTELSGGATEVETMTVSGQLTFAGG